MPQVHRGLGSWSSAHARRRAGVPANHGSVCCVVCCLACGDDAGDLPLVRLWASAETAETTAQVAAHPASADLGDEATSASILSINHGLYWPHSRMLAELTCLDTFLGVGLVRALVVSSRVRGRSIQDAPGTPGTLHLGNLWRPVISRHHCRI
jgi:hypothetical protein